MTLTAFLLARIAEDERDGWEVHIQGCPSVRDTPFPCECNYPARVLAECESKRRIVEMAVDGYEYNPNPTLRYLAAVHADHPDWREEWRA